MISRRWSFNFVLIECLHAFCVIFQVIRVFIIRVFVFQNIFISKVSYSVCSSKFIYSFIFFIYIRPLNGFKGRALLPLLCAFFLCSEIYIYIYIFNDSWYIGSFLSRIWRMDSNYTLLINSIKILIDLWFSIAVIVWSNISMKYQSKFNNEARSELYFSLNVACN